MAFLRENILMKFTFLGTGTSQGIPVIGCTCVVCQSNSSYDARLRSSLLVQSSTTTIAIDAGPDFRQQMLREGVIKLDGIVFTHEHQDHTAGLDDVRAFNFLNKKPVDLYANDRVQARLKQQYAYIFDNADYPGIPQIRLFDLTTKPFVIGDIEISPIKAMHGQLPIFGFRIGDFTYITDANYIDEENQNKIRGSEYLVLNALRKESHHSHFSLQEAIKLSQELGVAQTFFTHVSHQMGLHKKVVLDLPKGISLAYDGLRVEV